MAATAKKTGPVENKGWKNQLGVAKKETSFQQTLERFQLALKTNKFGKQQRTVRANKVLSAILEREGTMKKEGIVPLSNYNMLHQIFREDLATVSEKQIATEASVEIARFLARAQGVVTKEQKDLIIAYYEAKSANYQDDIENIRRFLTVKGLLAGKDAAKLPNEKQLKDSLEAATKEPVTVPTAIAV